MINKITLLFISIMGVNSLMAQQTLNKTVNVNGVIREYIIYVPAIYNGTTAVPLLFNFHGYGMTANNQMLVTGMRPVADTAGFILVYPQGTMFLGSPHWNVGSWTSGSTSDDIGFTEAMIDTLAASYNIDLDRVYSCGFSNGGYFCFELACKLGNKIASIGAVGGTMSSETYTQCNPFHPTPVITIHGTADGVVNYNGGSPTNSKSLADVNTYWANYNNTAASPIVSNLPDLNTSDGSTVVLGLYENGTHCTSVAHYKVVGGGHDWPGSWGNMDINSSALIWNFVSRHDINGLIGCTTTSMPQSHDLPKNYNVYPNPVDRLITIEMELEEKKVFKLYNLIGELVLEGKLNSKLNTIDLSSLAPSIYVLNIDQQSIRIIKTQ